MGAAAVAAVRAIRYEGAGTLEFLLDRDGQLLLHGDEHAAAGRAPGHRGDHRARPGRAAAAVAAGEPLPLQQHDVRCDGHAIEVRLCAEDAEQAFMPQSGTLGAVAAAAAAAGRACAAIGRRDPAVLRLDDRQDHQPRRHARRGAAQADAPAWTTRWRWASRPTRRSWRAAWRTRCSRPVARPRRSSSSTPTRCCAATTAADLRAQRWPPRCCSRRRRGRGTTPAAACCRRAGRSRCAARSTAAALTATLTRLAPSGATTCCWAGNAIEIERARAGCRPRALRLRRRAGERRLASRWRPSAGSATAATPCSRSSTPRASRSLGTSARRRRPAARVDERPRRRGAGRGRSTRAAPGSR